MARKKHRMLKTNLWRTLSHSLGRFFSIAILMALGSFALVGLKAAGPDMRATGESYFKEYNLADLEVISSMGIDAYDQQLISQARGIKEVEYGYLVDVTVGTTDKAVRIFSTPKDISKYEVVEGHLPSGEDEIAVSEDMRADYPLGSTISLNEKQDEDSTNKLSRHDFTVVGYVRSVEIVSSKSLGQTKVGTGDLKGYAVVNPQVFTTDYYMIARIVYTDTEGLDPYSQTYLTNVTNHKSDLRAILEAAPSHRLASVRSQYQEAIDEGQARLDAAQQRLNDTQVKLADAQRELENGQKKIDEAVSQTTLGEEQIASAEQVLALNQQRLDSAAEEIASNRQVLAQKRSQLELAQQQLQENRAKLDAASAQLKAASLEIAAKEAQLNQAKQKVSEYDTKRAQISDAYAELTTKKNELDAKEADLNNKKQMLEAAGQTSSAQYIAVQQGLAQISQAKTEIAAKESELNAAEAQLNAVASQIEMIRSQISQGEQLLATAQQQYQEKETDYNNKENEYASKLEEYHQGAAQLASAEQKLTSAEQEYQAGLTRLQQAQAQLASKKSTLAEALSKINDAKSILASKEQEYQSGLLDYNNALPEALQKIADGEKNIDSAKDRMNKLELPQYSVYTRREIPGANGYVMYDNVSEIIDSLSNIFPYFLYFVAALVTLTTMTRMVNEERIDSGTFKALGYSNKNVIGKFVCYGFVASMTGTIFGVATGHILIPLIVNNAYSTGFTMPAITLKFYPEITIAAFTLALFSAVVPTYFVAKKEVAENPASLLLPKAPANGSKILLERIPLIWNRLSFTQKVTARNLFRDKKRALMTISGVAGSVALIFAGFAVQNSINGIDAKQFGDLIQYDLIVAESPFATQDDQSEINQLLTSNAIEDSTAVHFETVTKSAGDKDDTQSITMIVPEDPSAFTSYIRLQNRTSQQELPLSDDGVIISERLANLTGTSVGDTFTFTDSEGNEHSVRVSGITEMYINHFIFMSKSVYENTFGTSYSPNAFMVKLKDGSTENASHEASEFMKLSGVQGVVQNVSYINQIHVIVKSLNKIMGILITLSALLAVVILYNLVTINVSERIRELSTIKVLGFYRKEVTMYIYKETIILTAIGIPLGWMLGKLLQLYIIQAVPPETVMFNPASGIMAYVIPVAVVSIVIVALYFVVNRKLRKVDMLEALKSVD